MSSNHTPQATVYDPSNPFTHEDHQEDLKDSWDYASNIEPGTLEPFHALAANPETQESRS